MIFRIVLLLLFCSHLSFGQKIEIAAGLSKYDYSLEDEQKFSNSANTDIGFGLYLGLNDVHFELMNFRFTVGISKSATKFHY